MKPEKKLVLLAAMVVIISAIACNLPVITRPTPFVFPTPDLTRTALHDLVSTTTIQTPIVPSATATALPSATATLLPSPTATPSPSPTPPPPTSTSTPIPPTATTAPTSTRVSYTGPGIRPGTRIKAYYLQREPTIDGSFDDWDLERYPVNNVVYGAGNWDGNDDLSAKVMVGWDDYNLYIATKVIDDKYVQNATGKNLFKGDSIEVLIDTKVANDFYLQVLSLDDFQLGVSPGKPKPGINPEAYLWYPRAEEGARGNVKADAALTDYGYRVEVAIPWSTFEVAPLKGRHYGFAFSVSDNDNFDKNLQQSMVSTSPGRRLTDPTTWGDLVLMGQY